MNEFTDRPVSLFSRVNAVGEWFYRHVSLCSRVNTVDQWIASVSVMFLLLALCLVLSHVDCRHAGTGLDSAA